MQFIDLIFLALTFGIGFVLYTRLGRRTGNEKRFFYPQSEKLRNVTPTNREEETLEEINALEFEGLQEIQAYDKKFSLEDFLERIKEAFEKVIYSFVKGDKKSLNAFLKNKFYTFYEREINLLSEKKITAHLEFFRLVSAEVTDVQAKEGVAHIQVHFVSEQTQVRKNKSGKIIEGDVNFIDRISELWTFERPLQSKGPWMLAGITPYEAS